METLGTRLHYFKSFTPGSYQDARDCLIEYYYSPDLRIVISRYCRIHAYENTDECLLDDGKRAKIDMEKAGITKVKRVH